MIKKLIQDVQKKIIGNEFKIKISIAAILSGVELISY